MKLAKNVCIVILLFLAYIYTRIEAILISDTYVKISDVDYVTSYVAMWENKSVVWCGRRCAEPKHTQCNSWAYDRARATCLLQVRFIYSYLVI